MVLRLQELVQLLVLRADADRLAFAGLREAPLEVPLEVELLFELLPAERALVPGRLQVDASAVLQQILLLAERETAGDALERLLLRMRPQMVEEARHLLYRVLALFMRAFEDLLRPLLGVRLPQNVDSELSRVRQVVSALFEAVEDGLQLRGLRIHTKGEHARVDLVFVHARLPEHVCDGLELIRVLVEPLDDGGVRRAVRVGGRVQLAAEVLFEGEHALVRILSLLSRRVARRIRLRHGFNLVISFLKDLVDSLFQGGLSQKGAVPLQKLRVLSYSFVLAMCPRLGPVASYQ